MILPLSHSFIHSFICPIHRSFLGACFSDTRVPTSPGLKEPTVYRGRRQTVLSRQSRSGDWYTWYLTHSC